MQASLLNQGEIASQERKRWIREVHHTVKKTKKKQQVKPTKKERADIEARLREVLTTSPTCCDLLMSLFTSALFHLRRSTICEPFPEDFDGPERNYDDAVLYVSSFPPTKSCVEGISRMPLVPLKLLKWIVDPMEEEGIQIKSIDIDQFQREVGFKATHDSKFSAPTHVFVVEYSDWHPHYVSFQEKKSIFGLPRELSGKFSFNFT
eukprot:TRINITY_DN7016_c0_g1_i3.p1 TRINITY_DN7016_c0_g1~~TRINITY_DN7016_c0_g1_i3.p1  ORF type:complete len:206 (+),score=25.43 TRINITY_DN7016_c0_g1_i3:64-681(+)